MGAQFPALPNLFISRQNGSFRRFLNEPMPCLCGFQGHRPGETLDKTINGRKSGNPGGNNGDQKHLTVREVERLIDAAR
jgi:hypothetical protein